MWEELSGGYGIPYDPRPALRQLRSNRHQQAVDELYENLLHQGDVGVASYAAVPILVDAGELDLVGAIEVARGAARNPDMPGWLADEYLRALNAARELRPTEEHHLLGLFAIVASLEGQHRLAEALMLMNPQEIIDEYGTDA